MIIIMWIVLSLICDIFSIMSKEEMFISKTIFDNKRAIAIPIGTYNVSISIIDEYWLSINFKTSSAKSFYFPSNIFTHKTHYIFPHNPLLSCPSVPSQTLLLENMQRRDVNAPKAWNPH